MANADDTDDKDSAGDFDAAIQISLAQFLAQELLLLYPALDENMVVDVSTHVAGEQVKIETEIIPTLSGPRAASHTHIAVVVQAVTGGQATQVDAHKVLVPGMDPGPAMSTALLLALLYSPLARAQLRVCGFQYAFVEKKLPPLVVLQ